ncbi:DUF226 domain-containing protein [Borreliella lusitaniae]|uniref:DUF226 domain-containing protein n=1 Tax=Borreliella lusitaniae TaxID=100177 RepID=UPI003AB71CB8
MEFRFKTGSVFLYMHALAYLIREDDNKFCRKLYRRLLDLEKEVFKFYSKDWDPLGIITKWIIKNKHKKLEKLDQIGNFNRSTSSKFRGF